MVQVSSTVTSFRDSIERRNNSEQLFINLATVAGRQNSNTTPASSRGRCSNQFDIQNPLDVYTWRKIQRRN